MSAPVVLLHGLGGSPAGFQRLRPLLADDGASFAPALTRPTSIDADADALLEELDRAVAKAGTPAVVVGHSRGGLVATALAERAPDLVGHLVLVNTPPTTGSRLTAHSGSERLLATPLLGSLAWRAMTPRLAARGLATAFAPGTAVPDSFVRDLLATGRDPFLAATQAVDAYLKSMPLPDRLRRLPHRVDVVFGTQDQRVAYHPYRALTDDGTIRRTEIPQSGHTPIWETPDEVARIINDALRTTKAR